MTKKELVTVTLSPEAVAWLEEQAKTFAKKKAKENIRIERKLNFSDEELKKFKEHADALVPIAKQFKKELIRLEQLEDSTSNEDDQKWVNTQIEKLYKVFRKLSESDDIKDFQIY